MPLSNTVSFCEDCKVHFEKRLINSSARVISRFMLSPELLLRMPATKTDVYNQANHILINSVFTRKT